MPIEHLRQSLSFPLSAGGGRQLGPLASREEGRPGTWADTETRAERRTAGRSPPGKRPGHLPQRLQPNKRRHQNKKKKERKRTSCGSVPRLHNEFPGRPSPKGRGRLRPVPRLPPRCSGTVPNSQHGRQHPRRERPTGPVKISRSCDRPLLIAGTGAARPRLLAQRLGISTS